MGTPIKRASKNRKLKGKKKKKTKKKIKTNPIPS